MTNYKKLFQLAEDKGYKSILCHIAKFGGSATLPHTVIDTASEMCELSLIQKWLRDAHGIYIEITRMNVDTKYFRGLVKTDENTQWYESFDTYEQALTEGIFQALKLIRGI